MRFLRVENGGGAGEAHNAMAMFKRAYFSLRSLLLDLLTACARGVQELHKDQRINALRPPGEW